MMVVPENNEAYAQDIAWLQQQMQQCGQLLPDDADDWNDPCEDGSLGALFEGDLSNLDSSCWPQLGLSKVGGCSIRCILVRACTPQAPGFPGLLRQTSTKSPITIYASFDHVLMSGILYSC